MRISHYTPHANQVELEWRGYVDAPDLRALVRQPRDRFAYVAAFVAIVAFLVTLAVL